MELIDNKVFFYLESAWRENGADFTGDIIVNLDSIYQHNKVRKHFGPPSLKVIWKHCDEVDLRIKKSRRLIFLTNDSSDNLHIEQRTVSAFLMAAYAVLRLDWDAYKANEQLLQNLPARLAFFRDYHGDSNYKLNILDCLRGLQFGCKINNWFNSFASTKFPQATNSHLDMNWIVPNVFLAFKDPTVNREKANRCVSKAVIKELKRCGIKAIVRLNGNDHTTNMEYYGNSYHANEFKQENFFHFEIPFKDVGIPTMVQAKQFVRLCERFGEKIAVHCHAGLGRTATMLGCHLIKNFGFDSRSVCGWLKMCRRGSVMGPQHFFLDKYEKDLKNIEKSGELNKFMDVQKFEVPEENTFIKVHAPSVPYTKQPITPTRISRQPVKNNIIHIAPSKKRLPNKSSPMQKYKLNTKTSGKPDIKRHKMITPQPDLLVKSTLSVGSKQGKMNKARPKSTVGKPVGSTYNFFVDTPTKRARTVTTPTVRKCVMNTTQLCFNPSKQIREKSPLYRNITRESKIRETRPMNKRVSKSYDAIRAQRTSSANEAIVAGSNSWNEWSGGVIDGLVTHSKSRIYGLINSVYSKNTLHNNNIV